MSNEELLDQVEALLAKKLAAQTGEVTAQVRKMIDDQTAEIAEHVYQPLMELQESTKRMQSLLEPTIEHVNELDKQVTRLETRYSAA